MPTPSAPPHHALIKDILKFLCCLYFRLYKSSSTETYRKAYRPVVSTLPVYLPSVSETVSKKYFEIPALYILSSL